MFLLCSGPVCHGTHKHVTLISTVLLVVTYSHGQNTGLITENHLNGGSFLPPGTQNNLAPINLSATSRSIITFIPVWLDALPEYFSVTALLHGRIQFCINLGEWIDFFEMSVHYCLGLKY